MAVSSPRIQVTVTHGQRDLLMELGALQGRSAASFLREMLDAAMPMLEAMLPVYKAAAEQVAMQPEALQKAIREAIENVDANKAQLDLLHMISASTASVANETGECVAGPSGAREERKRTARNKRA